MSTWIWILIGAAVFFFVLAPLVIIPAAIYLILLVRTRKRKWRRKCSLPRDEEIREMTRKCSRDFTSTCGALKVLKAEDMEAIYKMAR